VAGLSDEELQSWFDILSAIPPTQWRNAPDIPEPIRGFASFLPLAWLDGSEAPFLVVHGAIDEIAPAAEAQVFAAALQAAGVPTTLAILPDMYHRLNQEALHDPLFAFLADVTSAPE
jgi:dipeptidyl aminopeptidase/acylaminoacyl peptidase